ncbi:MAG: MFS transporter [Alphaproteobacteria bacterium]|nr:MFS transporter [Alphaproteobacteria bacterium]
MPETPSRFTAATLLLVSTLTIMAGAAISPSLPALEAFFSEVPRAGLLVRLVLTLPALMIALTAPLAGLLVDRFGRVRLLMASVLLYALAGVAGGLQDDIFMLLLTRAALGLGVAGLMTAATTLITDLYAGDARARMLGLQASMMGGGGVIFLLIGGALSELGWRYVFATYAAGFLFLPLCALSLTEPPPREDGGGDGAAMPWGPLLGLYAGTAFAQVMFYTVPVQIPFHLKELFGAGGMMIGLTIAVPTVSFAAASVPYGRVAQRFSRWTLLSLGFLTSGVGLTSLLVAGSYPVIWVGLAIMGAGFSIMVPTVSNWVSDIAPDAARGRALGGMTTAMFLGQFIAPLISQPLVEASSIPTMYATLGVTGAALGLGMLLIGALR